MTVLMPFDEDFCTVVKLSHHNSIYKNLILKILLQLAFTTLAVSEKTTEQIISILKIFIIFYATIHNKKNLLKESNNADKDKKDNF